MKKKSISTSTAEVEYIAAGSCCAQILWMKHQLQDYGLSYTKVPIYCDNQSAICNDRKSSAAFPNQAHKHKVPFYQGTCSTKRDRDALHSYRSAIG